MPDPSRTTTATTAARIIGARIVLVVILAAVLTTLLPAGEARACSCAPSTPAETLKGAEASFVGTLLDVEEPTPGPSGAIRLPGTVPYRFEVETVVAGDLPPEIDVMAPPTGPSCGLEVEVGERAAMALHREDGAWSSDLCSKADPAGLMAAGDPHPPTPTEAAPTEGASTTPPGRPVWPWTALAVGILGAVGAGVWVRRNLS